MKRDGRPTRTNSYQGSYLELPLEDPVDDDAFGGRIYLGLGPYFPPSTTNSRISMGMSSSIARESTDKGSDGGGDDEQGTPSLTTTTTTTTTSTTTTTTTFARTTQMVAHRHNSSASPPSASSPCIEAQAAVSSSAPHSPSLLRVVKSEPVTEEMETAAVLSECTRQNIVATPNPCGNSAMTNSLAIKQEPETSQASLDKFLMPPPPLPLGRRRQERHDNAKGAKETGKGVCVRDWNDHLVSMYGSVEKAQNRPWMSSDERDMLQSLEPNKKMMDHFSIQNWDFADPSLTDDKKTSPVFQLPDEEGLDLEICKQLQFVRDSIHLYRTMCLQHSKRNKQAVFLPFLRRNLRYSKFVPVFEAPPKPKKSPVTTKPKSPGKSLKKETDASSHHNQDLSIRLLSVKHNLLPSGHNASVTFFYTLYNYKTGEFSKVLKVNSSTFTIEVKDEVPPVDIDLPPELEYNENDPVEIFIVLRVVFFDASKDASTVNGKSLRNVPARLAGQCERAREQEQKQRRGSRRMRDPQEGDQVMYGALQITKKENQGWTYACGSTSLVLIETEKLGIDANSKRWQDDGNIVFRMVALGRKYHTNPFVYIEINSDDDESSNKSFEEKHKIDAVKSDNESDAEVVSQEFGYQLPNAIVYQLSLDFLFTDTTSPEAKARMVTAGFCNVVSADLKNMTTSKPTTEKPIPVGLTVPRPEWEQTGHAEELQAALEEMDARAPPPEMFTYCASMHAGTCIFCEIRCKNLFDLTWHLKTCHSRFKYTYRAAIEYKPGHFLPGFVMEKQEEIDDDMYWHRRKKENFHVFCKKWPQRYKINDDFIVPCNALFRNVTDGLNEIEPMLSIKDEYNAFGSRPMEYKHTRYGRLIKPLPDWIVQKMEHDLRDIVDLDPLEITFMLEWNKFLYSYGPLAGKETDVYKLCRLFVETKRREIFDLQLEVPTLILVAYFVQNKLLSGDELYDIMMRLNTNYDPFTDVLHPLSINEHRRSQKQIKKQAATEEKMRRKRPKKVYELSSMSLRRRGGDADSVVGPNAKQLKRAEVPAAEEEDEGDLDEPQSPEIGRGASSDASASPEV